MKNPIKKLNSKKWTLGLLVLIFQFHLYAQENKNNTSNELTYDSGFPTVISCDCEATKEKCTGTISWDDGSKYEGEFRYGKIHGQGKLTLDAKSSYEGKFEDETFHGTGTMTYEDGSKYIGEWVLGYREGEGVLIFPDGSEYMGEFESDEINGEGAISLSTGEFYSGEWKHGRTHGFGKITRLDGSIYLGMNNDGDRHGSGMIVWESGDTLHGSWQDGKMVDEAIFQFADGSSMVSHWDNGVMREENIYIKSNGEQFAASSRELPDQVIEESYKDMETVEKNFGLAFYAIGMEYKAMMNFDLAKENLNFAAQFGDTMDNFSIKEMVETQLANIDDEKESTGGVAKKEGKKSQ